MRIVTPSHEFVTPLNRDAILKRIEECGRTWHIVNLHHESVLEHCALTVRFVTDNGILRELTRHRIGVSFSVESTRFCSYANDQFGHEISVVRPDGIEPTMPNFTAYEVWEAACASAEASYFGLLERGVKPEIARSVLPLCTAIQ